MKDTILHDGLLNQKWFACMDEPKFDNDGWEHPFVMVGDGGVVVTNGTVFSRDNAGCLFGSAEWLEDDPKYEYCGGYGIIFSLIEPPEPGTYYEIPQEDKVKLLRALRGYFTL